jgi:hypothetical protein
MDISTIADIATILSLFVSILAIALSLKVRDEFAKYKIKNQGNIGIISADTVNVINGNAVLPQEQQRR